MNCKRRKTIILEEDYIFLNKKVLDYTEHPFENDMEHRWLEPLTFTLPTFISRLSTLVPHTGPDVKQ